MAATTGVAAEVPAMPIIMLPTPMQYGFCSPASADTSGYPRPVAFQYACGGSVAFALLLYAATAACW
mgnify:CR=1 FL=1